MSEEYFAEIRSFFIRVYHADHLRQIHHKVCAMRCRRRGMHLDALGRAAHRNKRATNKIS